MKTNLTKKELEMVRVALPLAKAQLCKHLPQALKQQVDVVYFNADKIYTVVLTDKSEIQFKFLKEARPLIEDHLEKLEIQAADIRAEKKAVETTETIKTTTTFDIPEKKSSFQESFKEETDIEIKKTPAKKATSKAKYDAPVHTTFGSSKRVISEKELVILKLMIKKNTCCALTIGSLAQDNMSCSTADELVTYTGWNRWAVAGVLSSLDKRGLITPAEKYINGNPKLAKLEKVPALWWVSTSYLAELDPDIKINTL